MAVRDQIRDFVVGYTRMPEMADDFDLFDAGLFSSLFVAQLLSFIEDEFSITISDDELDIDNFRSIAALERVVLAKTTPPAVDLTSQSADLESQGTPA